MRKSFPAMEDPEVMLELVRSTLGGWVSDTSDVVSPQPGIARSLSGC